MMIRQKVVNGDEHTAWFIADSDSLEEAMAEAGTQWPDAVITAEEMAPDEWPGSLQRTCIVVRQTPEKLFRVDVIADDSGKWVSNAMRYLTREDAEEAARDLEARWTLVREWRVVPDAGADIGVTVRIARLGIVHGSAVCIGKRDGDQTCTWRHVSRPAWFGGEAVIEDKSLQEVMRRVIEDGERLYSVREREEVKAR